MTELHVLLVPLVPFLGRQAGELVGDERAEERGAVEVCLDFAYDLGGGDGGRFVDGWFWGCR